MLYILLAPSFLCEQFTAECRSASYNVAGFYGIEWPTFILANTDHDGTRGVAPATAKEPDPARGAGDPKKAATFFAKETDSRR